MSELPKFWSDDFDMERLEIFPNIREARGAATEVTCWTVGRETFSRLNQPNVWNLHGAFLRLEKAAAITEEA